MWYGLVAILAANLAGAPEAACPSDGEVQAELARLGAGDAAGGMQPEISIQGSKMRVVLRGRDGPVGSREVEAPASCHERATIAAVLVATWMGVWPQGPEPTVPQRREPSSGSAAPPRPMPASPEFGLFFQAAHDGHAGALGLGLLAGRAFALQGRLRGFLAASVLTEREDKVGPGQVGYTRPSLEAGPALRWGQGRLAAEVGLSARLALLLVRGKGLAVTHSATHPAPGLGAHVRFNFGGRPLVPFALVSASYWLSQQTLTLDNEPSQAWLPRWDMTVGLGLCWAPGM
jgi:hypothetical protein